MGIQTSESTDLAKNLLEVGSLYHSVLFSYQRGLKHHLGDRANIYVNPAINHLLGMEENGLKLDQCESFEQAISALSDFLSKSKMVKCLTLEDLGEDNYAFRVEGCVFAGRIHTREVSLKDVTCPYALVAMALYKKCKGFVANENESEYFHDGTETILEPAKY